MTITTSYLSRYVHEVLIELAECRINSGYVNEFNNELVIEDHLFVTSNLILKWNEIEKVLGKLPDGLNVLEQSTTWFKEILKSVWEIVHDVGQALLHSTLEQRTELWKSCENLRSVIDLNKFFNKLLSGTPDSKLQVLLVLTSSLERFLGNVYLVKGQNVPFLLRDLLNTKELLEIFGGVPIIFTQLLVGCPLGLNIRNVAWHGFLSSNEICIDLVATLFLLFTSLNNLIKELGLNVPERNPVQLNFHGELLYQAFPDLSIHVSDVNEVFSNCTIIPDSHKVFWIEAFQNHMNARYDECLIVILPQLEHFLRLIYCFVNDCPNRLLTAEATDLYITLDEILEPPSEGCTNVMIEFLGYSLLEILEDILSYPEGPRIRDKISHGEFNLFNEDNMNVTKVLCNHVFSVGLSVIYITSQKLKVHDASNSSSQPEKITKTAEDKFEYILCKFDEQKEIAKRLNFLEHSLQTYKSRFHPVSYLLRTINYELNKLLFWNELPRLKEFPFENVCKYSDINQLKFFIAEHMFNENLVNSNVDFFHKIKKYVENVNSLTLHRPRNEGIIINLMRQIMKKISILDSVIKDCSNIKYELWNKHKMRSRSRQVYQTMLKFVPHLQTTLINLISIVLYEIKFINQLPVDWHHIERFYKYALKYIENVTTYCSIEKNQWQEVIKLTLEFNQRAFKYLCSYRFETNHTDYKLNNIISN